MLELLQRIPENPAVSCAMPILRMEHDSDLLTDQHGKHLDGEGVPQRVRLTLTSMPKLRQRAQARRKAA